MQSLLSSLSVKAFQRKFFDTSEVLPYCLEILTCPVFLKMMFRTFLPGFQRLLSLFNVSLLPWSFFTCSLFLHRFNRTFFHSAFKIRYIMTCSPLLFYCSYISHILSICGHNLPLSLFNYFLFLNWLEKSICILYTFCISFFFVVWWIG